MTKMTVIKPFTWTNARDSRGVVHRVVSLSGVMHLCAARCGADGRWSHTKENKSARPIDVMTWTDQPLDCMTCVVVEARHATA